MARLTPESINIDIDINLRTDTQSHEIIVLPHDDPNREIIIKRVNSRLNNNDTENKSVDIDGPVIILIPKSGYEENNLLPYLEELPSTGHVEFAPIGISDNRIAVVLVNRKLDTYDNKRRIKLLKEFESIMECYRHEQLLAQGGRLS